jgi:hypothetical protein
MSKLRVHNFVVSLDGYASGEAQSIDAAVGHAQREFLDWFGKLRIWRGGQPSVFLDGDLAEKVSKLKPQPGPDLYVYGSANLVQTLMKSLKFRQHPRQSYVDKKIKSDTYHLFRQV